MRKFAKISAVLAAMILALAFVGCKNDDDDDDDDPSVVTTWYCEAESSTIYFYDDGSVKAELGGETYSGSYSGDTTKDGDIIVIIDTKYEITITDGKFHFDGGDYIKK